MKKDTATDSIRYVQNSGGPKLGYSELSGVQILEQDGLFFKNLSRTGTLQPYEDWRLSAEERAKDLAHRLTPRQIAGLMMNGGFMEFPSDHSDPDAPAPWEVTDRYQYVFRELGIRHMLIGYVDSVETMVRLNNNRQAFIESLDLPIPLDVCSDPRHGSDNNNEFNQGAGTGVSQWTESLGLAAAFDPELIRQHGKIASLEYRALGITTALSPQVDLATEPRWNRVRGTFGEGPKLAADLARAYIDGFQTSDANHEIENGWGTQSVAAVCKHWPGGGTGEGGRDAHHSSGKYAVYPGGNFEMQLIPFVNGALNLNGKTGAAAGMMPYYTISYQQDKSHGENVANAYSEYMIRDLLRKKYGFQGMVCSDWEIVKLPEERKNLNFGIFWTKRCWGVETLSAQEQYYRLLMNTIDQFGGDNDLETLLEGYELGCQRHGETFMRRLLEESAVRTLTSMFRIGLFENPYLEIEDSEAVVNCPEFRQAGFNAQVRSIIMLKNHGNVLPLKPGARIYVPKRFVAEQINWRGERIPAHEEDSARVDLLAKDLTLTDRPENADAALVFVSSPQNQPAGPPPVPGNPVEEPEMPHYEPITLQYRPYTAVHARAVSVAGDDPNGTGPNRSYRGRTVSASNESDLDMILETRRVMSGKPVIVIVNCSGPCVLSEFEPDADGILIHFDVHTQPLLEILTGRAEPSGLLPMQFPADMDTVEAQNEDVPFDMVCYQDCDGNVYDYAYGMNWNGVIQDSRTEKYQKS